MFFGLAHLESEYTSNHNHGTCIRPNVLSRISCGIWKTVLFVFSQDSVLLARSGDRTVTMQGIIPRMLELGSSITTKAAGSWMTTNATTADF
jgi:hypothetical protein